MDFNTAFASIALATSLISLGKTFSNRSISKPLAVANIFSYSERYSAILQEIPHEVLDTSFDITKLGETEQLKLLRIMWIYFDLCFEEYTLFHTLHLIDRKLWMIWEGGMKISFNRAAFAQSWKIINDKAGYPEDFQKFIAELQEAETLA